MNLVSNGHASLHQLGPASTLVRLLEQRGHAAYFGEPVSILEHSLQAAHFAEEAKAAPVTIAAALLHDIGHMLHGLDEDIAQHGYDGKHEMLAADYLSKWFGLDVTTPIRLHVPAKRFLCWQDAAYLGELSPSSLESLALQGGPMRDQEAKAFLEGPFAEAALQLRRWDDQAKIPGLHVPDARHYFNLLDLLSSR